MILKVPYESPLAPKHMGSLLIFFQSTERKETTTVFVFSRKKRTIELARKKKS